MGDSDRIDATLLIELCEQLLAKGFLKDASQEENLAPRAALSNTYPVDMKSFLLTFGKALDELRASVVDPSKSADVDGGPSVDVIDDASHFENESQNIKRDTGEKMLFSRPGGSGPMSQLPNFVLKELLDADRRTMRLENELSESRSEIEDLNRRISDADEREKKLRVEADLAKKEADEHRSKLKRVDKWIENRARLKAWVVLGAGVAAIGIVLVAVLHQLGIDNGLSIMTSGLISMIVFICGSASSLSSWEKYFEKGLHRRIFP